MDQNDLANNKEDIKCTPSVDQWTLPDSYATNEAFVQNDIKLASEDSMKDKNNIDTPSSRQKDDVGQEIDTANMSFVNSRSKNKNYG